ncbi:hypothetical protein ACFWG0_34370 [Streptomyces yangpuensis]|uniref:hypothetical protein n=1 Tax=Streptomyces yangpuensis TaxID=1648182 RepID=UPI003665BC31
MSQAPRPIDVRVQELAARSANFGFLMPHQPLLLLYGAGAEASLFDDPDKAVRKARKFGETLATDLIRRSGTKARRNDHAGHLHALVRGGFLDQTIREAFEDLRSPGLDASFAPFTVELAALRAVRRCFQLGVWFHRLLTGDRDQIPFIPPQIPSYGGTDPNHPAWAIHLSPATPPDVLGALAFELAANAATPETRPSSTQAARPAAPAPAPTSQFPRRR